MKETILTFVFSIFALATFAQTKIVAHRGYWQKDGSAQNSITSLRSAAEIGCWGSEFDVWITTDGVCVVNHDATIEGKRIDESKYADLKNTQLKNGETLPTLEQYLWEGCHHPEMKLVLEIKDHNTPEANDRCVDEVLRLVKKYCLVDQVDYISFSIRDCERLMAEGPKVLAGPNGQRSGNNVDKPEMKVAYLSGNLTPAEVKAKGLTGIDYERNVLLKDHPEWIEEAHKLGLTVNIWTVDDLDDAWDSIVKNIDFVTTNRPLESVKLAK